MLNELRKAENKKKITVKTGGSLHRLCCISVILLCPSLSYPGMELAFSLSSFFFKKKKEKKRKKLILFKSAP